MDRTAAYKCVVLIENQKLRAALAEDSGEHSHTVIEHHMDIIERMEGASERAGYIEAILCATVAARNREIRKKDLVIRKQMKFKKAVLGHRIFKNMKKFA